MDKRFIFLFLLASATLAKCQDPQQPKQGLIDSMTTAVTDGRFTGIHSILVASNGKTVYEQYFNGWTSDSLHDSRSAFKSITSLLTGIAIDKGFIKDVRQKVYSYFPEFKSFDGNNAWKKDMTIEHLLRMQSGFDCEEFDGEKDCETDMMGSRDWVDFSLSLPMKSRPGTVWAYTSSDPMILSGIISRVTKTTVMDFAAKYLFSPLGITQYRWTVDPAGHGMTAGSFYLLPADLLKIGQLILNKGMWYGRRIVSAAWLEQSTAAPVPIPDFSFVRFSKSKVAIPQQCYYGYYWYKEEIKTNDFAEEVLFASGNGGQYLMVIERTGLVVVFTQGNYNSWKAKKAFDLLAGFIIPAFEKP